MAAKPLIGVNVDYRSARKGSSAYCYIHAGYCNSLSAAGAVPMLLPPTINRALVRVKSICLPERPRTSLFRSIRAGRRIPRRRRNGFCR